MRKLLILTPAFLLLMGGLLAQQNPKWDYPIKPGTDAWASLHSSKEMIEVCEIPANILPSLSTASLADLCLNYPLLGDMLLASNFQEGFDHLSKSFNGFQELFTRQDAGFALLNIYKKFDLASFHANKKTKFRNVFFDMCIDVVMAQPVFLEKLNSAQETILINESLRKLKIRQQIGDSFYRQKTTAVILSRLLTKNNSMLSENNQYGNDKYLVLNNYFILEDESMIDKIIQQTESYLVK